jgi:hypothetical protein
MIRRMMSSVFTCAVMLAVTTLAQQPAAQGGATVPAIRGTTTSRAVEPSGPPVPLGPYADVTIESAAGLPTHTVYRPTKLAAFPGQDTLPIVVWGNGACRLDGLMYKGFLTKIASHGFLVVVAGPKDAPPPPPPAVVPPGGTPPPVVGLGGKAEHLIQAIDWAFTENRREGSPLRGKIDTGHVAMMGQSCGGLMAIEAAHDPRITTLVIWNSGVLNNTAGTQSLSNATKETLKTFHTNTAYFNGGPTDVAFENSNDDVSRINQVPVFYGVMKDGGHMATYAHVNGGKFAEVGANWLMWRLKGNKKAGAMFEGATCGLCTDPNWTVQKKQMR